MLHRRTCGSGGTVRARFMIGSSGAASLEGALSVGALVVLFAMIIGIVGAFQLQSRVDRAAWAIARANSVAFGPAASLDEVKVRAQAAVEAGVGTGLDHERLEVVVTAYATPTDLEGETPSGQPSATLGGDPNDMVVIRVRYSPSELNLMQRLLGPDVIESVAVVRNESEAEG